MRLLELVFHNFRGLREFRLCPNGGDLEILADNGCGKTTAADGYLWLLTGRDSLNRAEFDIKTLGSDGEPLHHLEHSVEAVFDVAGSTRRFKRTLRERWTRRRGASADSFDGHETIYHVDHVPCGEADFKRHVGAICPEEQLRLLSDPSYFCGSLHWQKRRAMLLNICGDVSDRDVIASDPGLGDLELLTGDSSLDDFKKRLNGRRAAINRSLQEIPVRISEATRSLSAIPVNSPCVEDLRAELEGLTRQRAGGPAAEKVTELRTIEGQMIDRANALKRTGDPVREGLMRRSQELQIAIEGKRASVKALERLATATGNCPTCGQPLPSALLLEDQNRALNAERVRLEELLKEKAALKIPPPRPFDPESDDTYRALKLRAYRVGVEIEELRSSEGLDARIASAQTELDKALETAAKVKARERGERRIGELESELRRLTAEFEELDRQLFLTEAFLRAKVRLLTERINSRFSLVTWRLFETQVNGGLNEVCEPLFEGRPYSTACSHSERIKVGLDCIRTLSEYAGVAPPVFIDNAESIVDVPATPGQQIRLVVDPRWGALHVAM